MILRGWKAGRSLGLLLAIALSGSAACGPSKEATERAAIVERIDAVWRIPATDTSSRARAAEELRRTTATAPDTLAARDACADFFAELAEGLRLLALAEAAADVAEKARTAADAERHVTAGDPLLDRCSEASAALRLKL